MIEVIQNEIANIMENYVHLRTWQLSQFFAFLSLIAMFWSFQIKNKLRMMLLNGVGTTALAISAAFLGNWTLCALFGQASVRNYIFCYFEHRKASPKPVAHKWWYIWAVIFAVGALASTFVLVHIIDVESYGVLLEWLISFTLVGLVIGNVVEGTNVLRISFVFNRIFNIINHWYFYNIIAVFIACMTISSNIIYYCRLFINRRKEKHA